MRLADIWLGAISDLTSATWIFAAALGGDIDAARDVGDMFMTGSHIPPALDQAVTWLEKNVVSAPLSKSIETDAVFCRREGEKQLYYNLDLAELWLERASHLGDDKAKERLQQLQDPENVAKRGLKALDRDKVHKARIYLQRAVADGSTTCKTRLIELREQGKLPQSLIDDLFPKGSSLLALYEKR